MKWFLFSSFHGPFRNYSTATSRLAIRNRQPWTANPTVRHEMGLSTTFNRSPSTIPKSEISKPLVDGLPILQKCCHCRPLRAKRSRWAAFVAQHQTSHFGTGLFDHICQPIARVSQKAPSQISYPGLQWVRKSQTTVHISTLLRWGAGRHRFRHPVHLRKWLWSQKEPEPFIYLVERATGSPRVCFANPCFAAGHWPLRAALENAHAFSQLRTLPSSIPVARHANVNGSGTQWSPSR